MQLGVQEMRCEVHEEKVESAGAGAGCVESIGADHKKDAATISGETES